MSSLDPVQVFRTEAVELFEQIELNLLDLNNDLTNQGLVDAVFRGLHTLKGSGAMFGFEALAAFTHHCETAFDAVRKGSVPATPALVSAVLDAQSHMKALIDRPHDVQQETGEELLAKLQAAIEGASGNGVSGKAENPDGVSGEKGADPIPTSSETTSKKSIGWTLKIGLPPRAMVNGTNPLGLLDELRELGECTVIADASRIPDLPALEPTEIYVSWTVTLHGNIPKSAIEDVFIFVLDEMSLEMTEMFEAAPEAVGPEAPSVSTEPQPTPIAMPEAPPQAAAPVTASTDNRGSKPAESVRVPAERLDELMDRVGELVIAQSRLSQLANASADVMLRSVSEDVERLSGELRDTMMGLRMVPVGSLFARFRRLVHDLSRETGKTIELETLGETTEVDKTVIERLADPLVHLVRNSVDHGLEPPDERLAAGKSVAGKVTLSARQSGGQVIIAIKDDGRGIDRARVRAKAESTGLIAPGQPLTDQELMLLIFEPGFSTAAQITSLSGRGVGMDVVKKTVETLRGIIDVKSEPGQGSEISLRIPLTLAIIDGLLIRVGAGNYVIPLSAVEECVELSLEEDQRSRGRSFISLRDSLVPFLRLREVFNTSTPPDTYQKMVVISTGNERVGLVVDQIIGDHQTVIKSMSKLHHDVTTFSGATILGDGSVALILDVAQIVSAGQQQEAQLRAIA
ncbi:chemotaxis protein CheA [Rhizobium sp. AAP43]|uniref:chemotaxis protein CheA n=1 Tax=Rhizobium sp. AAP43 TaxID=1523420 RepID=UPI0006B8C429|nr:chemotaxis protein CheA [Rhizobium sp. AAP43]KPF47698.1 chemotaxis protein CheA [Rhizobium sp. AAP43]